MSNNYYTYVSLTHITVCQHLPPLFQLNGRSNLTEEIQFLEFFNPILRKAAPLIISSEANLVENPIAVDTTKHF